MSAANEQMSTANESVAMSVNCETPETYNENISKCVTDDHVASELVVAVMTVCAKVGSSLNLLKIFELYTKGEIDKDFELDYVLNAKKKDGEKKRKAFYNCLSCLFYFKDSLEIESKVSAKIFPNGSIQLPGCRTIETVHSAPEVLFNFINSEKFRKIDEATTQQIEEQIQVVLQQRSQIFGECLKYQQNLLKNARETIKGELIVRDRESLKLEDVRIVMINSNFVFQKVVDGKPVQQGILQERLKNVINQNKFQGKEEPGKNWRMATFQPGKYAGVNIKYWTKAAREKYAEYFITGRKLPKKIDGQISIFVFKSGKGTITAAKNSADLLEAYQEICKLVRDNSDELFYKGRLSMVS